MVQNSLLEEEPSPTLLPSNEMQAVEVTSQNTDVKSDVLTVVFMKITIFYP
jgi:hypothetical protein